MRGMSANRCSIVVRRGRRASPSARTHPAGPRPGRGSSRPTRSTLSPTTRPCRHAATSVRHRVPGRVGSALSSGVGAGAAVMSTTAPGAAAAGGELHQCGAARAAPSRWRRRRCQPHRTRVSAPERHQRGGGAAARRSSGSSSATLSANRAVAAASSQSLSRATRASAACCSGAGNGTGPRRRELAAVVERVDGGPVRGHAPARRSGCRGRRARRRVRAATPCSSRSRAGRRSATRAMPPAWASSMTRSPAA